MNYVSLFQKPRTCMDFERAKTQDAVDFCSVLYHAVFGAVCSFFFETKMLLFFVRSLIFRLDF